MTRLLPFKPCHDAATVDPAWRSTRLAEARAVIADVAHHGDSMLRLACDVIATLGETPQERAEGRALRALVDARVRERRPRHRRQLKRQKVAGLAQDPGLGA